MKKKAITLIGLISVGYLIIGCSSDDKKENTHLEFSNNTTFSHFNTFKRAIECDDRGYAYYVEKANIGFDIHTPIFENKSSTKSFHQVKCEEL